MSGLVYDNRFDEVEVVPLTEAPRKEKLVDVLAVGLPRDSYVTMEDLERTFSISNYHVRKYLKRLGIEAFGEQKNVKEDGTRTRGVGKKVYRNSVVDDIRELLNATIDVERFQEEAREILEE